MMKVFRTRNGMEYSKAFALKIIFVTNFNFKLAFVMTHFGEKLEEKTLEKTFHYGSLTSEW